jgi:hypothetical protein
VRSAQHVLTNRVREWDETYKTIYYVNPSTTPPSTSWTHPGMAPGQVHPEQTETTREAESMYAEADGPDGGQPGERGFVTKAAVGFVGYKALKHLLANKNKPQQPQYGGGGYGQPQQQQSGGFGWGTAVTGAAAGAGGAFLLTKLFNVSVPLSGWAARVGLCELRRNARLLNLSHFLIPIHSESALTITGQEDQQLWTPDGSSSLHGGARSLVIGAASGFYGSSLSIPIRLP